MLASVSSVLPQAMKLTFGIDLAKPDQPLPNRRPIGQQHVQSAIEGDDDDLDLLALAAIVAGYVGRHIQHRAHLGRIVVADLQRQPVWLRCVRDRPRDPQRELQTTPRERALRRLRLTRRPGSCRPWHPPA